jgi:putative endonuclease
MYSVYIIKSDNKSYVGMTNNFFRRIRQHNKEIKGGARYTSKSKNWLPICIIDGFKDKSSACQCEWRLKRGKNGPNGRIEYLSKFIFEENKWTKNSDYIENQDLNFYIDEEYLNLFFKYKHSFKHKELYWKY